MAEVRQYLLVYDFLAQGIRQPLFQTITYGDSHLALIGRNQKNNAIVFFCPANAPRITKLSRKSRDILPAKCQHCNDNNLMPLFLFQLFQIFGNIGLLRCIKNIRSVGYPTGERDFRLEGRFSILKAIPRL